MTKYDVKWRPDRSAAYLHNAADRKVGHLRLRGDGQYLAVAFPPMWDRPVSAVVLDVEAGCNFIADEVEKDRPHQPAVKQPWPKGVKAALARHRTNQRSSQ